MNDIDKLLLNSFKWARENTLDLFDVAIENCILSALPNYKNNAEENKTVHFQFQCIATTTDARIRMMKKESNQKFGVLVTPKKIYKKREVPNDLLRQVLLNQIGEIELLHKSKQVDSTFLHFHLQQIVFHEYLHQGQLIVMFREFGTPFPGQFDKAWDLSGST